ncbi:MAG: ribbon-helix-helix protein, CopG family [Actinobacteria bacterium]|nr:ribbon-helix-helix protein, CopG family [Actinomycetota bacterium]
MSEGRRARADERARRINAAAELLDAGVEVAEAARRIARRFGLSQRQARRYVEQAREVGEVAVPEPTVVFTVRLPASLVDRLRGHAHASGRTLSSLVAQAVAELLERLRAGRAGG